MTGYKHAHPASSKEDATALVQTLSGVSCVLITPFYDGFVGVDKTLLSNLAASIANQGIHSLTALGNTAEVHQLDWSEREAVLGSVAAAGETATLIAGVSGPFPSLIREAELATELGYKAIMVHEPTDPFGDAQGLLNYYFALCDASPLPVVLYLRTSLLDVSNLARLIDHPAVVGVKYARSDLESMAALRGVVGSTGCVWINGAAETRVADFLDLSVTGFTSGLANAIPAASLAIHQAAVEGDQERLGHLIDLVRPLEDLRTKNRNRNNVAVIKELLRLNGLPVGQVRPPHMQLDTATALAVRELREAVLAEIP
ncbi:dihydrodipicolinate synthase family protein [Nesterenkonia ebinurensis]|uniref:dihydrodipicolinate synthase family protein n=1 Tax=Nesterenkonia ebinurensis TaxID=2608252 RepID=UPI00123DA1C2|nr:dihydrodipicolinate synthase family protein [Nesterenkonia ebinurensis]